MSKSSLRVLAVLLTVGILVVLLAGLDGLPGAAKTQIAAERKSFTAAQSQLEKAQADVSRTMASEMALFNGLPSAREYPDRLNRAFSSLSAATPLLCQLRLTRSFCASYWAISVAMTTLPLDGKDSKRRNPTGREISVRRPGPGISSRASHKLA